nr:bifunctional diguanylate cyclase/phosphodiesterase [uncultured Pseudomonas sp.]
MRSDFVSPLRVAAIYALFSSAWIMGSDYLLDALGGDSLLISRLQTVKGLLFILLSSLLILFLSYRDRRAQRRLLDELNHNTRLLQQTQHTAGLGYWQYDGRLHWSEEALRLLARPTEDAFSSVEQLLAWLHPAERPAVQRAWQALIEERQALSISARLYLPQQPQCSWVLLRAEVDCNGRLLGTVQDISNQKRDEAALRESEQRFRQLFERTPRIAVQGYDRERRVIYWNQASTQLYGYSMQEAMGKRLEELIVPKAGRPHVVAAINSWLLGGPAIQAAEVQLQRKDGKLIWVFSSHSMLRNTRDQLELYCIDIDLSEQKQTYNDLHASEERFRDLVEHLNDAIFLADADGRLTFHNPAWAQLSGFQRDESLGQALDGFFTEPDRSALAAHIAAIASGTRSSLRGEFQLRRRDGQIRRVELQLNHSQADNSLRGCLRDIHERFELQQLQEARNDVLDDLLASSPLAQTLDDISARLQGLNPHMQVSIMLLDEARCLHVASAPSLPADYCQAIDGIQAAAEIGSCGHAAYSGELTIAEDLNQHPYWQNYRELTNRAGLHACWSLPFKNDQGRVLGTFGIYYDRPTLPSDADIALVTEFTRLASLAVQQQQPR